MHTDELPWPNQFSQKLHYTSTALISAGVIYLLAANWLLFPKIVQLLIPQCLLLISCFGVVYFKPHTIAGHCCAAFAALMIGMSLATYGQVYQTGADSYQLFLVWALLLLPWLGYRLSAVWIIFDIIVLTLFHLVDAQLWSFSTGDYLLYIGVLFLLLNGLAQLFCQSGRLVLMIISSVMISFISLMILIPDGITWLNPDYPYWLILSILTPLLLAGFYYWQRYSAGLALACFSLAINCTGWVILNLVEQFGYQVNTLFILAAIVLVWFWFISKLLKRWLVDKANWSKLPMLFGAWLAGILLLFSLALLFKGLDGQPGILISLVILVVGLSMLRRKSDFILQLSYAITLSGQFLLYSFLFHLPFTIGIPQLIAQCIILVVSFVLSGSQFWRTLQCWITIFIFLMFAPKVAPYLLFVIFILILWKPAILQVNNYRRPLLFSIIALVIAKILNEFAFSYFSEMFANGKPPLPVLSQQLVAAVLVVVAIYLYHRKLSKPVVFCFMLLSLTLILLKLLPILALLICLLITSQYRDKIINFMLMATLAFCLWLFYYQLTTPLLTKGMTIIASGLLVGIVSYFTKQQGELK